MLSLPAQIAELKRQITEVEEALSIAKNPPSLRIDESGYPALDAVRRTLAQADSAAGQKQLVAQIEHQLASQRQELARLEAELAEKQAQIAALQAEQQQVFQTYQQLEAEMLAAARQVLGLALEISNVAAPITDQQAVVFSCRPGEADKRLHLTLSPSGQLQMGVQPSGLLQNVPSGLGSFTLVPIDSRKEAKAS